MTGFRQKVKVSGLFCTVYVLLLKLAKNKTKENKKRKKISFLRYFRRHALSAFTRSETELYSSHQLRGSYSSLTVSPPSFPQELTKFKC